MKINKNSELRNNRGFTTADLMIAVITIVIFVSIIVTTYYNYYLSITSKNRNAIATNCIIDVIESIEMMNYNDITDDTVKRKIQELYNNNIIPGQYTVTAVVQKYNETDGNTDKKDLIKKITVTAEYSQGSRIQKNEISRLITKKEI